MIVFFAAALLAQPVGQVAPSTAAPSAAVAGPATGAAKPKAVKLSSDDKVTCQDTTPTGSFIPQRECHTQAQWRAMNDESQDAFRNQASSNRGFTSGLH